MANIHNTAIDTTLTDTTPTTEPVTLEEVKDYLKLYSGVTADDTLTTSLITASRREIERLARVALVAKDVVATFTHNIENEYTLPTLPAAVTKVEYRNCRLVEWQDLTASQYSIEGQLFQGGANGHYRVTYTSQPIAGADMQTAKDAILKNVADKYFNRGDDPTKPLGNAAMHAIRSLGRFAV